MIAWLQMRCHNSDSNQLLCTHNVFCKNVRFVFLHTSSHCRSNSCATLDSTDSQLPPWINMATPIKNLNSIIDSTWTTLIYRSLRQIHDHTDNSLKIMTESLQALNWNCPWRVFPHEFKTWCPVKPMVNVMGEAICTRRIL